MHKIVIQPVRISQTGQRYRVMHDGRELIASTSNPEYAACRALLSLGLSGRLFVYREGREAWDSSIDIVKGAGSTVTEGDHGIRLTKFYEREEFPLDASVDRPGATVGADF